MTEGRPGDITLVLQRWRDGDPGAIQELAPLVYERLRRYALSYVNREQKYHTLQATGLVNELFVVLMQQSRVDLSDRVHFFAFAARLMRRILVDHARAQQSAKRGGGQQAVPLCRELAWVDPESPVMLDLANALDELESVQERKARLVELRVFVGLTADEAADLLGISKATADRDFRFALAWLADRIQGSESPSLA